MESDYSKTERVFLHDLSNQLVIAQGMGKLAQKKLIAELGEDRDEIIKIGKNLVAIEKIIELVKSRRNYVKSFEIEASK